MSKAAVWIKTAKNGEKFLSIKVGDDNVVAFKNKYKKQENQPDYVSPLDTSEESTDNPHSSDIPSQTNDPNAQAQIEYENNT